MIFPGSNVTKNSYPASSHMSDINCNMVILGPAILKYSGTGMLKVDQSIKRFAPTGVHTVEFIFLKASIILVYGIPRSVTSAVPNAEQFLFK